MPEFNPNHVIHGCGGTVWLDGKKLTSSQPVEIKATVDFEGGVNDG